MSEPKMIFVFGSNELGMHGGGAAKVARDVYGARYEGHGGPGQGFGPQGNSFAIPTCSTTTNKHDHSISYDRLKYYVQCFLYYADLHPEFDFQVTQVGCGLAGWTIEDVAPLFRTASRNCLFDTAWKEFLPEGTRFWGHRG